MTSLVNGYDTQWSSIADIHQEITLNGTASEELEFLSGSGGKEMITWQQWMEYLLYNKKPIRPKESMKIITDALNKQQASEKLNNIDHSIAAYTIYDAIRDNPHLTKFKKFTDYIGYGKLKSMEGKITLFAPINEKYDEYFWSLYNVTWSKSTAVDALRYHILPYLLLPHQLENRKLRLRTDLDHRSIDTDWTHGRKQLLNPLSYSESPGDWFPKTNWEVNIIGIIHCDNGIVYVIDRPLVYPEGVTGTN